MRALSLIFVLSTAVGSAFAGDSPARECVVSFAQVQYDVCRGEADFRSTELDLPATVERAGRVYRVVKFAPPVGEAERAGLIASGAEILAYLPHDAYLVRVARAEQLAPIAERALWTGDYLPMFKVGPVLARMIGQPPALDTIPVTVVLHPGEDEVRVRETIEGHDLGASLRVEHGPRQLRLVVELPPTAVEALAIHLAPLAEVAAIQFRFTMDTTNADADWVHQSWSSGSTPVFDHGIFGCGQVVGYMDSGMDFDHCAFWDSTNGTPPIETCNTGATCPAGTADLSQRKVALYYKWSDSGDTLGDAECSATGGGHGSHVGGSIAGDVSPYADCAGFTSSGNAGDLDGTAPGAKIIHQEMGESLDYINSLGGTVYHALDTAYTSGARIHSNSWGGGCCFFGIMCILCSEVPYDSFARDADLAVWDHPDMTVLFAAGNDGDCCDPPAEVGSPGVAKNVVTIGATDSGSSAENPASFSSGGRTLDRRTKPDVMAQGNPVDSSASDGATSSGSGCSTCSMPGTSMATPTAAGLSALVREYLARGFYPSGAASAPDAMPDPSAALVKALLVDGARDMTGGSYGTTPNQKEGWGRITLDDVLYFPGDARKLWLVDGTAGLSTGAADEHSVGVGSGQPLKVTLVWSDYPAAENANPALVNDLRLEVVTPGGETYTQKIPGSDPPDPFADTATSGYDDRNTVEQVVLTAPAAGQYTIRVRGVSVAMGPQPYALVATGDLTVAAGDEIFSDGFELGLGEWSSVTP